MHRHRHGRVEDEWLIQKAMFAKEALFRVCFVTLGVQFDFARHIARANWIAVDPSRPRRDDLLARRFESYCIATGSLPVAMSPSN
jgi:hypothetical protein